MKIHLQWTSKKSTNSHLLGIEFDTYIRRRVAEYDTLITSGIPDSDREPQDSGHDIPDSFRESLSSSQGKKHSWHPRL